MTINIFRSWKIVDLSTSALIITSLKLGFLTNELSHLSQREQRLLIVVYQLWSYVTNWNHLRFLSGLSLHWWLQNIYAVVNPKSRESNSCKSCKKNKKTKKNIKMETKIALETKTRELGTFKPLREWTPSSKCLFYDPTVECLCICGS